MSRWLTFKRPPAIATTLRYELADSRRPVAERRPPARPVRRTTACAQQIVTGAADEEWTAPLGVIARLRDVFARDPDRLAVDSCGPVIAPARPRRVADLRLVAREAVSTRGSVASIDNIPGADADD